jgi:hypothetical protein
VNIIPFTVSRCFLFLFQFDTFNTTYTKKNESNMKYPNAMGQEFIHPGIMDLQGALFLKLRLLIFLYRTSRCVIKFKDNNKIQINQPTRCNNFTSLLLDVMLVVIGPTGPARPGHDQQYCYHHTPTVKPEAATAVVKLLMMGVRTTETC